MNYLLITIMTICCKYENNHFCVMYLVYKSMFLIDAPTPLPSTISRELFRFACARTGMFF